jgi:hypothetical protein
MGAGVPAVLDPPPEPPVPGAPAPGLRVAYPPGPAELSPLVELVSALQPAPASARPASQHAHGLFVVVRMRLCPAI